jgi:hypothetical protein
LPNVLARMYFGTATSSAIASHFCSVLRDSPVRFAIARTDLLSRTCIRRILPNISMVITLFTPAQKLGSASKTPGSVLSRHNLYKWLSFRSAATRREQREKNGGMRAWNGDFRRGVLKRQGPETAPTQGERAKKSQPDKGWDFGYWWWNAEPNPRPLSEPDSNAWALRAWIQRFGHRHCAEPKSNSSQSLPDHTKPSASGMVDAPFGRMEKCRLFPVVLSDQVV